jgi:hypothetical protein
MPLMVKVTNHWGIGMPRLMVLWKDSGLDLLSVVI